MVEIRKNELRLFSKDALTRDKLIAPQLLFSAKVKLRERASDLAACQ
jgi:hypothetical protein